MISGMGPWVPMQCFRAVMLQIPIPCFSAILKFFNTLTSLFCTFSSFFFLFLRIVMLSFRWHLISYLCGLWMQRVSQPTLIVTRFEYANLFHTVTDWYSAYMTSRIVNLKKRPRVVFVDGHCKVHLKFNSAFTVLCFE